MKQEYKEIVDDGGWAVRFYTKAVGPVTHIDCVEKVTLVRKP